MLTQRQFFRRNAGECGQGCLAAATALLRAAARLALLTRRHIAVVHFADLRTLDQPIERTGDRPLGEPGGLAHLGRPEPLRPRGREGRQDLPLTTGWLGGRRWAPWPRLGGRRRGGRRTLGWRGGSTGLAGLAFFEPLHRRN